MREAAKKSSFNGPTTKEKRTFLYIFVYFSPKIVEKNFCLSKSVSGYFKTKKNKNKKFLWPLSRGGEGVKALVVGPLKKELFFAASLSGSTLPKKKPGQWKSQPQADEQNSNCLLVFYEMYFDKMNYRTRPILRIWALEKESKICEKKKCTAIELLYTRHAITQCTLYKQRYWSGNKHTVNLVSLLVELLIWAR